MVKRQRGQYCFPLQSSNLSSIHPSTSAVTIVTASAVTIVTGSAVTIVTASAGSAAARFSTAIAA